MKYLDPLETEMLSKNLGTAIALLLGVNNTGYSAIPHRNPSARDAPGRILVHHMRVQMHQGHQKRDRQSPCVPYEQEGRSICTVRK